MLTPKQNRIINMKKVLVCLEIRTMNRFNDWYNNNIEREISKYLRKHPL